VGAGGTMNAETDIHTLPIDAHVVAIDATEFYEIDKADRPFIAAIRNVYLYDKNSLTHICSLTPSYWLVHLYDQVIFNKKGNKLSDDRKNEIYEKYEFCGNDDDYFDCGRIDAIEDAGLAGKRFVHHYHGATGVSYEDTPYDEQIDSLREHFSGNTPI
jgi:hypothetical protein